MYNLLYGEHTQYFIISRQAEGIPSASFHVSAFQSSLIWIVFDSILPDAV